MADNDKIEKVIIETENKVLDRILFIYFFFAIVCGQQQQVTSSLSKFSLVAILR